MSSDSSQHPQGQDTRGHPHCEGLWPRTWGEGGKTPGVSMLSRRPSQRLWDTWDWGPCPHRAVAELPPMNSWQLKMLQGSVWIRREPSTSCSGHGPASRISYSSCWHLGLLWPWSLRKIPFHCARSRVGGTVTFRTASNAREAPTPRYQENFSSPILCSTEPALLCASPNPSRDFLPPNVVWLLTLLPWLTGRVVWGLGFVGVWFCWGFSVAKTSPSLNRVRDHPSKVAQSTRVPPSGDPNPCPTAFPLQLPRDEGGESRS